MDAMSEVFRAVQMKCAIFFDMRAPTPWVAETPQYKTIAQATFPDSGHLICYQVITGGTCWACNPRGRSDTTCAYVA